MSAEPKVIHVEPVIPPDPEKAAQWRANCLPFRKVNGPHLTHASPYAGEEITEFPIRPTIEFYEVGRRQLIRAKSEIEWCVRALRIKVPARVKLSNIEKMTLVEACRRNEVMFERLMTAYLAMLYGRQVTGHPLLKSAHSLTARKPPKQSLEQLVKSIPEKK